MKTFTLGLFIIPTIIICLSHDSNASQLLYIRGFVPYIQQVSVDQASDRLNISYKQNSTKERAKLTLEIERKDQALEVQSLTSEKHSLYFLKQAQNPIQKLTLIQH